MVFTIEPQFRISEEKIYVRLEDKILMTQDGPEVLSDYFPIEIEDVDALMREPGLLQRYPGGAKVAPASTDSGVGFATASTTDPLTPDRVLRGSPHP